MGTHYNEQLIKQILQEHKDGCSPTQLGKKHSISRSTIYRWIKERKECIEPISVSVSAQALYNSQKQIERLQLENEIMKISGCTPSSPLHDKLEAMVHLKESYTIYRLCKTLGVLKSTYLYHIRKTQTAVEREDDLLKEKIHEIFEASKQRFGSKKIRIKLMEQGIQISQKKVVRLMREMGISCHLLKGHRIYAKPGNDIQQPNILNQDFVQTTPNKAWVSDITYLHADQKTYYLCVVLDLFSRMVLSYTISDRADTVLVADTFNSAFTKRNKPQSLLFHSDKGVQYTAEAFCKMLNDYGVKQSFSKTAYPYDNAVAESFFSSVKREEVNRYKEYGNFKELKVSIDEYIHHYNYERPHQSLKYKTPAQIEQEFSA